MKRSALVPALLSLSWSFHAAAAGTFGEDVAFLKEHIPLVVLQDESGTAQVAVAPAYQGRVMTSTANGAAGNSFGWINHDLIAAGKTLPHINAYGGEDRFWLGPEGGQFSLFFKPGDQFDLAHWQTPEALDTMPFPVVSQAKDRVRVAASFSLVNFSGTRLDIAVEREVALLPPDTAWRALHVDPLPGVKMVAYESDNKVTNAGTAPWTKETGAVSIWILGMFNPAPETTIVVPIKTGTGADLGPELTSDYFGVVPADRLKVQNGVIYFSGDGKFRSKIGVAPKRSKALLGSYDAENHVLTIVQYDQPAGVTDYVNSLWKVQDHPFAGDSENSYNDGAPSPGAKPLGPFYEMESSSPAALLAPGASLHHLHRTMHLTGLEVDLDRVARAVLGVSLADIRSALP